MKRIGLIGAMETEVTRLRQALVDRHETTVGPVVVSEGLLCGRPVALVRCGVGKVNAALCTQLLIDRFAVEAVINTGVAGGLHPSLRVGDLVIATAALQHDFDVSALGYVRGNLCEPDRRDSPTLWETDPTLRVRFAAAARELYGDEAVKEGRIVSGDRFIAGFADKADLRRTFDGMAAEMEGAAVAQTAAANDVPFLIVRAISDLADGSGAVSYEQFEYEAAQRSAALTETALSQPD